MTDSTDQAPEVVALSLEQASTNFFWTLGNHEVFNLQTTIRGLVTDAQLDAYFATVKSALAHVVQMGGHAKPIGQQPGTPAPAPSLDPVVKLALEEGNKALAAQLQTAVETVDTGEYDAYEDVTQIVVRPQPDALVDLEFMREGLKWAVVKVTKWKQPKAQALLKHVTSADVAVPARHNVKCRVYFKHGKEYPYEDKQTGEQKTGRYKDVVAVRLIQ